MRNVYFLTKTESEANINNSAVSLTVNCTGTEYFYAPFKCFSQRNDYSFVYVLNGLMEFEIDGNYYSLTSNDFMIIPPTRIVHGTNGDFLNYYWLQITGKDAESFFAKYNFEFKKIYKFNMSEDIKKIMNDINTEFIFNDNLFDLMAGAKLTELFSAISRNLNCKNRFLTESCEYIHKHYDQNISVPFLAAIEHISVSNYRLTFKKAFGVSPIEYITKLRINAICHYLINTDASISEIAAKVGYKDPLYLSRIFRKKIGVSATEYRKNAKRPL